MESIHGHTNLSIDDTRPSRRSVWLQTHCLLHSDATRHSHSYRLFYLPSCTRGDHVPFARYFTPVPLLFSPAAFLRYVHLLLPLHCYTESVAKLTESSRRVPQFFTRRLFSSAVKLRVSVKFNFSTKNREEGGGGGKERKERDTASRIKGTCVLTPRADHNERPSPYTMIRRFLFLLNSRRCDITG